jgi:hypothetical protein|tara:strand:- start:80 stop:247 length:168 start_codon:yes stop_codon:yes gene_type:complete
MSIVIYRDGLYYFIAVTKEMLIGIPVKKGMDLFEMCTVLAENLVYEGVFFGCFMS